MKHRDCFICDYARLLAMTKTAACASQPVTRNSQHVRAKVHKADDGRKKVDECKYWLQARVTCV